VIGELVDALTGPYFMTYLSVIVPMGLFNLIGSLQNLESAAAAGDDYPTAPSLAANGIGTLVGALFGSTFPTTIYIGHPGWKALGARIGYSWLDGIFVTLLCMTGTLGWIAWAVPIEAGMAIVLWIGIVITAQAFQATPRAHAPAVVVGILPGVAAWGAMMIKAGVRASTEVSGTPPVFGEALGVALTRSDVYAAGAFSLEQGFILTAMVLAATVVAMIEGQFRRASAWLFAGAALSAVGLMHGWAWGVADTTMAVGFGVAGETAVAYAVGGVFCLLAPLVGRRDTSVGH